MKLLKAIAAAGLVSIALVQIARTAGHDGSLAVPGRANANVSLAADGRFVVAVWSASVSGGATDIFASVSRDRGATFSDPARVNATPGEARVNGEQPPRVALVRRSGEPEIVAIWTARRDGRTILLTGRSADGGRTFGRTSLVSGTDAPGNRGWEAIAADPQGRVSAIWLDHRDLDARDGQAASTHHHAAASGGAPPPSAQATADGVARAQLSKLYFATIGDEANSNAAGAQAAERESAPRQLTGGVCYCCKTALAIDPSGRIHAAWRHVYDGNMRDIAYTVSRDGGRSFAPPLRISRDDWQLEGCPDDGPALALDPRGAAHVIWPTRVIEGREQTIALFHAVSDDARPFTVRERLDTRGVPHHPQLAVSRDGLLAAAWDESAGGQRQAVLATGRLDGRGGLALRRAVLGVGEAGSYPVVAFAGDAVVAAWTSGEPSASVIRVRKLPAR